MVAAVAVAVVAVAAKVPDLLSLGQLQIAEEEDQETSITFGIQHLLLDNRKTCASHGGGLLILLETLQIGDQDGDAKCLDETKQYLLK